MTEKTFTTDDYTVTYDDTYGKKVEVFEKFVNFIKDNALFDGNEVHVGLQNGYDDHGLLFIQSLANDVIKFEVKDND